MTAMMAFFLVMWLLAIASPCGGMTQIAEYFRTPLKVALTSGDKSSSESSPTLAAATIQRNSMAW